MCVGANFVVLEFPSLPENVGLARLAVAVLADEAGFTVEELEEIKVAVSEAVTNAIVHGYPGRSDGTVRVEARRSGTRLRVRVVDEGVGMADVARALDPEPNDDPERLGLGFAFMRAFMDELTVESELGCGTEVEMEKGARVIDPARDER